VRVAGEDGTDVRADAARVEVAALEGDDYIRNRHVTHTGRFAGIEDDQRVLAPRFNGVAEFLVIRTIGAACACFIEEDAVDAIPRFIPFDFVCYVLYISTAIAGEYIA